MTEPSASLHSSDGRSAAASHTSGRSFHAGLLVLWNQATRGRDTSRVMLCSVYLSIWTFLVVRRAMAESCQHWVGGRLSSVSLFGGHSATSAHIPSGVHGGSGGGAYGSVNAYTVTSDDPESLASARSSSDTVYSASHRAGGGHGLPLVCGDCDGRLPNNGQGTPNLPWACGGSYRGIKGVSVQPAVNSVTLGNQCFQEDFDMWSVGCVAAELYSRQPLIAPAETAEQAASGNDFAGAR